MPTSPTPRLQDSASDVDDPLQMYLADVFTVSANLAGLPAVSVPCGFTADRPACRRPAAHGTPVRRSDAAPDGRRLRARYRMVDAGAADREPLTPPDWTTLGDEQAARGPHVRSRPPHRGDRARSAHRHGQRRARGARHQVPAALLAVRRVVHAGRRARHRDPVLPRASAARKARAGADARSRRRRSADVPEDPAPRGRPRDRQRIRSCGDDRRGAGCSATQRRPIPNTTRRNPTARASSSTWITGTRRAIRTRTSPRRSPSGSIRNRIGRRDSRAGRRSASSNTWIA